MWWNYGWNYMKFHPNSTHNSTYVIPLIYSVLGMWRWKSGITFQKYFSGKYSRKYVKICEKVVIPLQKRQICESFQFRITQSDSP